MAIGSPSDAVIKNAWYVAAQSAHVSRDLLARRIADEPMVLYRTEAGTAIALEDRCPHRGYLLSRGSLDGDRLVCGYHGFTFDPAGRCIAVPGQTSIPAAAKARAYPVVERDGAVWVYAGDPARADATAIPPHAWLREWNCVDGYARIRARVVLIDNLVDLSHETYLHPSQIGSPEVARTPIESESDGDVVRISRRMFGVECPPFYQNVAGLQTPIDRSQEIEFFAPGFYVLSTRVAAAGDRGPGFRTKIVHGLTPETARTSHDFWWIVRDIDRDDTANDASTIARQTAVLQEDIVALEALEDSLATNRALTEVSIGIDRGGLLSRRALAERAKAEGVEAANSAYSGR
jgi:phenylpropionate dioxygenase-like ring-hydroxylating dioxygenase large terminal subunit